MTPEQLQQAKLYGDAERDARRAVAPAWDALRKAVAQATVLEARVSGGDLQFAAELHAENKAVLGGADAALIAAMQQVVGLIEAIQAGGKQAGLNVFPGVTVTLPESD